MVFTFKEYIIKKLIFLFIIHIAIFSCAKKLTVTEPVASMSVAKDYTIKLLIYGGCDLNEVSSLQVIHFDPSGNSYTNNIEAQYVSEDRDDNVYAVYDIAALYGTVISLEAKPSSIHNFERFIGMVETSQENVSFQVKGNGTIGVYFTIDKYKSNKPYIDGDNYEIRTAIHLKWIADYIAEEKNFYNKTITLINDIDLSTLNDPFVGIGNANINEKFAGTFDGGGYTVSGLDITTTTDYTGFIGILDKTGTIKNLKLSGSVEGKDYTGAVVGYSYGVIENVESSVNVVGGKYTGGIVGYSEADILKVKVDADVTGKDYTGGLVGYTKGNITDVEISGNITGENYTAGVSGYVLGNISKAVVNGAVVGKQNSAGISGYNKGNISSVLNTASITGENHTSGISGYNYGNIINATNEGTVNGTDLVGSIAGYSRGELKNVYNKLSGSVTGNEIVGGIAGYHFLGTLTEANNMAVVDGVMSVGGLVGNNAGTIIKADNSGQIKATRGVGLCNLGGLVGRNDGVIKESYNTGTITGNEGVGGISGLNYGSIEEYSRNSGTIEGIDKVGGLIGINHGYLDNTSYNTGSVKKDGNAVGDLIGLNYSKTLNLTETFKLRSRNVLPAIGQNAF